MADLAEAKQKQQIAYTICGVLIFIGIMSIFIVDADSLAWIPWVIDIFGAILGGVLALSAETMERIAFKALFDQTVGSINDTPLNTTDIDINLIASENSTKTDSGLLDM